MTEKIYEDIQRQDKRINYLDGRVRDVELDLAVNKETTLRLTEVIEKFSDTLTDVSKTMNELSLNARQSNNTMKSLAEKIDNTNIEMGKLNNKIEEVDNKTKIDVATTIRKWAISFITSGGIIGMFIYLIKQGIL